MYYICIDIIIKLIIVAWSGVSGVGSAVEWGGLGVFTRVIRL